MSLWISHLIGASRFVNHDDTARWRLNRRVDPKLYMVSDLQDGATEIVARARRSTVLIRDGATMFSFEPWSSWQFEHGVLGELGRIAETGIESPRVDLSPELLKTVARLPWSEHEIRVAPELLRLSGVVSAGTLAPLAGAPATEHAPEADLRRVPVTLLRRSYRSIFNQAADGAPVLISMHNDPVAVLEPFSTRNRETEFVRHVTESVRFLTAYAVARADALPLHDWVVATPYPWLGALESDAIEQFSDSLLPGIVRAMQDGEPDLFAAHLRSWQVSCESRADAGFLEALRTPVEAVRSTRRPAELPPEAPATA